jgi:phosphatidylethanolamine/phosphatidyl-N-methylethanolamine N-methyltransferase
LGTSRKFVLRQFSAGSDQQGGRGKPKRSMEQRFGDEARFIRAWLDNPLVAGAVSPSGKVLSRTMAGFVDPSVTGPVVELGPGTGPVTDALIQRGIAQDRLVLVEFDPDFCKLLARRYPRACIVQGDAYDLTGSLGPVLTAKAAAVVSSLPLLTKPERQRIALLQQAFELMQPGGVFVQFTYGISSPVPRVDENFIPTGFQAAVSPPVWLNLPPARVWTYREGEEDPIAPQRDMLVRLRVGTDKLGEEWRERRRRLHDELVLRAEKAKLGLKARTEKLKSGLERHQVRLEATGRKKIALDLLESRRKAKKPPRW